MTRAEVKHAIQNALPTPNVPDELVWEVLSECIAEQTGQQPRLVTLMESVQSPDAHARMRVPGCSLLRIHGALNQVSSSVPVPSNKVASKRALRPKPGRVVSTSPCTARLASEP